MDFIDFLSENDNSGIMKPYKMARKNVPNKAGFDYSLYGLDNPEEKAKKESKQTVNLAKRLAKIRYWEQTNGKPWILMLLKGLESSHDIHAKTSYPDRWDNLKKGLYWGQNMDVLLRLLDHDYGIMTQDELRRLIPLLNFRPEKTHQSMLATHDGMITKNVFNKMTGLDAVNFDWRRNNEI